MGGGRDGAGDPREVLSRTAPAPTTTVRYGEGPDHVADVWLPDAAVASASLPLVVVIHGGFWRAGYGRSVAAPMSVALRDDGYAVAAVEYRRTGVGGGWPATAEDVRAAVETVPRLLGDRAPGPTVLVGHSAGGHLALWAASQAAVPRLAGVVSLGGVCDLVRADQLALDRDGDDGAVATLLGGRSADVPERYAAADPMQLPPPRVPVVLVHGVEDRIVPVELSRRYAAYARAAGAAVRLVELPGIEHFGPVDPLSPAWSAVRTSVAGLVAAAS
ncbi:MAG: alpha/beta fold hydrolase [Actinomycetales bacterium]